MAIEECNLTYLSSMIEVQDIILLTYNGIRRIHLQFDRIIEIYV